MLFRTMGGALNGNIGVMRTMVSEIVQEKKCALFSVSSDSANREQVSIKSVFTFSNVLQHRSDNWPHPGRLLSRSSRELSEYLWTSQVLENVPIRGPKHPECCFLVQCNSRGVLRPC